MLRWLQYCVAMIAAFPAVVNAELVIEQKTLEEGYVALIVSGAFHPGDDLSTFVGAARTASDNQLIVVFNSPGGNPAKAMELGRIIRLLRLPTVQIRGLECSSACALAFVGGVWRSAEAGSIGVHKASFSEDIGLNVEDAVSYIQQHTAETIEYLSEMGVDPGLLQLSLRYDRDDMRYLSRSEMEQYRVVTATSEVDAGSGSSRPGEAMRTRTLPDHRVAADDHHFQIPDAVTGKLRVPKGSEFLRSEESQESPKIAELSNGDRVEVLSVEDRWYRVRAGGKTGYLHHNWVRVDQFLQKPFEDRFIQIASFDNFAEAEAYVKASKLPLSVYLATNRWFAVALNGTAPPEEAKALLDRLKSKSEIPPDAFMTVGNTYVREVCCQP